MSTTIEVLKNADESIVADINKLLKQLRTDAADQDVTLTELEYVVRNQDSIMVVVKDGGHVVGMATLYIMQKMGKRTGQVEDVVVDETYRGQGLGEAVMKKIIDVAREERVKSISLTSRPERVAGNKLYQKLGFEQKQTNVYRFKV
jgi:ribosomal protein S18 acetylase RimI-like enzyme